MAEAITLSGQLAVKWVEKAANTYLNSLLKTEGKDWCTAGDTDSMFLSLGPLVEKVLGPNPDKLKAMRFLKKFADEKLTPVIRQSCKELCAYMNAPGSKLNMKLETISDRGVWTGKKRYILNVLMEEGGVELSVPKVKATGGEAIRSSTPEIVRKRIKELYRIIVQEDEPAAMEFIAVFREEFMSLSPEEIASPRSANGLKKYAGKTNKELCKKGCPVQVRGSLLYNKLLEDHDLGKKFQPIRDGEKIRYVYLKEPNPLSEHVIAMIDRLPKQFGLHDYLDYEKQYDVTFFQPAKAILDVVGWKTEETFTLGSLFG